MTFLAQSSKVLPQSSPKWHNHVCHRNTPLSGSKFVLVFLLLAWNTITEVNQRGKGLFDLYFHITVHHWRKSDKITKRAGTWRQELMYRLWMVLTGMLSLCRLSQLLWCYMFLIVSRKRCSLVFIHWLWLLQSFENSSTIIPESQEEECDIDISFRSKRSTVSYVPHIDK